MRVLLRILIAFILIILIGYLFWISVFPFPFRGAPEGDQEAAPQERVEGERSMSERVSFRTKDDKEIVGDYYRGAAEGGRPPEAVLLLHMMPSDRKSWGDFAARLQKAGFPALAIDLRGHGESQDGPNGYKNFRDADHQASRFDIEAAEAFLSTKGVSLRYLAGASIGANLALEYAAGHPGMKAMILLSPGLDYRGIKTEPFIERIGGRGIFLAASEEDEESFRAIRTLAQKIVLSANQVVKTFVNAGHGTTILERNPDFMDELVEWLKRF